LNSLDGYIAGLPDDLWKLIMKITTLPVYSKLADEKEVRDLGLWEKLPINSDGSRWQLSQHQVDTYRALTEGDYDVIFNTAMTGDGKSLAAYLPVLAKGQHAFGMYPTNELLKDQGRQFERYLEKFKLTPQQVTFQSIWGAELDRFEERFDLRSRAETLKTIFDNRNVLLTNPDIFNLVMNYNYAKGPSIYNDQELPYSLSTNFDYLIFDEFHIFNMPQIISALTAMLYIARTTTEKHRYIFSSATMTLELQEMVQRSGLRYREINGDYRTEPDGNYRQVLYPAELNIHKLEKEANAEAWIFDHVQEMIAFWNGCNRNAKGVVLVNSVASARRIVSFLEKELSVYDISVGENTGLADSERRKLSMEKNIIVGTSTIDVGVDFNINFLVFESTNSGTFLQRLGRLGRVRMGELPFQQYVAHALLSPKAPWLNERIEQGLKERGFKDGDAIDRPSTLRDVIHAAYPEDNAFLQFAQRWGILQGAHVINVLENPRNNQGAYASTAEKLKVDYASLCRADFRKALGRYKAIAFHEERGKKILDEVLGFRGSSPLQVACWDATVQPNSFLSYDLFSLIQTAECSVVGKDEYLRAVQSRFRDENQRTDAADKLKYTLGKDGENPLILRIEHFNVERDWLTLKSGEEFALSLDRVSVIKGFSIDSPRTIITQEINTILRRQSVVCYITREEPMSLHRMLHLPPMFPLIVCADMHRNRKYTVAFGKNALLLDSVLLKRRNRNLDDEPIIV
jgi:CRISPR-associated endonuclease/helicase Cas3